MGEARQRRYLIEQLMRPERRADIAACVRSVDFVSDGGTCAMRAVTGQKVLAMLGVKSRLVFGAMLYRAGPDELVDTVAFCGPDNRALRLDHKVLGHYWLEAGGDLIDFTVGDWREQDHLTGGDPVYDAVNGVPLPPTRWTTTVPDFWWRPSAELTAPWRENKPLALETPPLGVAWYHAAADGEPMLQNVLSSDLMRMVTILMSDRVSQLLADWRSGTRPEFVRKTFVKNTSSLGRMLIGDVKEGAKS
jgi:hypothetical protein